MTPALKEHLIIEAQAILDDALKEIRLRGLAPRFRWNSNRDAQGNPHHIGVNIGDFDGFIEISTKGDV